MPGRSSSATGVALIGYELVEGRAGDGRLAELRRVDFTPRTVIARRGD